MPKFKMENITLDQFERLTEEGTVLERDAHGIKVLETPKQEIIKIFRLKRQLSSARFRPYALRFADNSVKLKELGIPTVEVKRLAYCPDEQRHLLVYPKLPGTLLRDALVDPDRAPALVRQLGTLMAQMHQRGIYFRSVHFKNVLLLEDGQLGLIDISDMSIKRFKLRIALRLRNFRHMLRYEEDHKLLAPHLDGFIEAYLAEARLSGRSAMQIQMGLQKLMQPEESGISS